MLIKYHIIIATTFLLVISSCNTIQGLGTDFQVVGGVLTKTSNYKFGVSEPQSVYPQEVRVPVSQISGHDAEASSLPPIPIVTKPIPFSTVTPTSNQVSTSNVNESSIKSLTGNMKRVKASTYVLRGVRYTPLSPEEAINFSETGICSFYSAAYSENAIGDKGNYGGLTGAHKTLPLPSIVRVKNLQGGKSVVVRINDRGPYVKGRILDLAEETKRLLGENGKGLINVRMDVVAVGDLNQITR